MAIQRQYKLLPRYQNGDAWIQIEDLRTSPDDADPGIEFDITRGPDLDDCLAYFRLTTEEAAELAAILRVILGYPSSEDLLLVNGADALD